MGLPEGCYSLFYTQKEASLRGFMLVYTGIPRWYPHPVYTPPCTSPGTPALVHSSVLLAGVHPGVTVLNGGLYRGGSPVRKV